MRDLPLLFAALANSHRLAIVEELARGRHNGHGGALGILELARRAEMTRFAASRHLSVLREAGLVTQQPCGAQRVQSLDDRALQHIEDWLVAMLPADF